MDKFVKARTSRGFVAGVVTGTNKWGENEVEVRDATLPKYVGTVMSIPADKIYEWEYIPAAVVPCPTCGLTIEVEQFPHDAQSIKEHGECAGCYYSID